MTEKADLAARIEDTARGYGTEEIVEMYREAMDLLDEDEFGVIAKHHESETWVWGEVAKQEIRDGEPADKVAVSQALHRYHQARARMFRQLEAEQSQKQDEYEAKHRTGGGS